MRSFLLLLLFLAIVLGVSTLVPHTSRPKLPVGLVPSSTQDISTTTATSVVKTAPVIASVPFGISFGDTLPSLSRVELDKRLDDLVSLGLGWMRFDISWQDVQSQNSYDYDWSDLDRIIADANARHIKLLPDIGYTPSWARPAGCTNDKCAPADPAVFAHFAQVAAKRYASKGITSWEIWNEPNVVAFWQPQPSAKDYTTLLELTSNAIKSVDPSATVISGGLAPSLTDPKNISPIDFLDGIYGQGGGAYFDAVGFHPYSFPLPPSDSKPWSGWTQMANANPSLRSIMIANGDSDKKIWLTEYGAPTGGPKALATISNYDKVIDADHVSDELQSLIVLDAIRSIKKVSWDGPLFIYSYKDLGNTPETNENFFGLIRQDGSLKPVYTALKSLLLGN